MCLCHVWSKLFSSGFIQTVSIFSLHINNLPYYVATSFPFQILEFLPKFKFFQNALYELIQFWTDFLHLARPFNFPMSNLVLYLEVFILSKTSSIIFLCSQKFMILHFKYIYSQILSRFGWFLVLFPNSLDKSFFIWMVDADSKLSCLSVLPFISFV